jgi:hypothetical protein
MSSVEPEIDIANKSYKMSFNIPANLSTYSVIVSNNIFDLHCKVGATTKFLKGRMIDFTINEELKSVNMKTLFIKEEAHIFNYLLDRSELTINDLFKAIKNANGFFDEYEITRTSMNLIDKYINGLSQFHRTWTGLTNKPDYNLTIFANRTLPYFKLGNMDWVKANIDANNDYPTEMIKAKADDNANIDDYHEEIKLANKNNNFLEWQVLPFDKYPNMDELVNRILLLVELNLKRQAINMICRLMLSPRECHIIKRTEIWDILNPEMKNKDLEVLIKYCMYYAMYILKQEETIMFSKVNNYSRVLFTISEANKLPTFDNGHIDRSPYIVQLTNDTQLGQTMPFYLHAPRRINTKEVFIRRFDIASGGAFRGFDLKSINASITGSILIPCVHRSPLEEGFEDVEWDRQRKNVDLKYPYMVDTPKTPEDIAFINYLEYYYPSYASLTDDEYNKQVLGVSEIQQNDETIEYETADQTASNTDGEDTPLVPKINKSDSVNQADNSESKGLDKTQPEDKSQRNATEYNQLADIDISITTKDLHVFKERALRLYDVVRKNCEHRGPVHIKEITTIASIKYKIYGPGVPRPMDVFRIIYDPVKMIKKFHVNAVKMYYDNDVIMFRACVSALLSGVGETYKWFSCNKIPADVLFKYVQRGISIILNTKERNAISNYITDNNRWGDSIQKLRIKPNKIYCCTNANHPFFRPGMYNCGIRMNLRRFERDSSGLYANTLVIPQTRHVYPYGEIMTHNTKKIYMPDYRIIQSALDYIENNIDAELDDGDAADLDAHSDAADLDTQDLDDADGLDGAQYDLNDDDAQDDDFE